MSILKKSTLFISSVAVCGIALISFFAFQPKKTLENDDPARRKIIIRTLLKELNNYHYLPKKVDDKFSAEFFDRFIELLDPNKLFFHKKDIDKLSSYKTYLDDELEEGTTEFFDLTLQVFNERIIEAEEHHSSLLKNSFDFTKDASYETDSDKKDFAGGKKEIKERWEQWLKFRVLTRLQSSINQQEKEKELAEHQPYDTLELAARTKEIKFHNDWFKRIHQVTTKDRFESYVNAAISLFDPHSNYFPPQDKENFDISISGRLEGIGARLQSEEGYVKVTGIVPGSASWRQGELEENDLIIAVGQSNQEPIDVVDMKLGDVVNLIRGKKGTEVRLTVQKVDGTQKIIPITRDIVILEEGYAKSSIIKSGENAQPVGYIYLPKFYTDFNNQGGRTCSQDIKNEIEKLKQQNVGGIVLDLRDNGGGSLRDVVEMGGLFIEQGPIVQVKYQREEPTILENRNSEVTYDGPLVIMINSFSASASEILAAAMQDYDRAIIVGSTSFGKGTVQRFIDLDRTVFGNYEYKPLGSLKLTIQKFYRINGGTNQLSGVKPDIELPDIYSQLDIGEKEYKNPLAWSEITPAVYQQKVFTPSHLGELKLSSAYRIDTNSIFKIIKKRADLLKNQRENTSFSLNLEAYDEYMSSVDQNNESLNSVIDTERSILVKPVDKIKIENIQDSAKLERQDDWINSIKRDIYIEESMHIIYDQLELMKTSNKH